MSVREYRILTIFRLSAVTVILGGAIYYFKVFFEKFNPYFLYYLVGLFIAVYAISIALWFSLRSLRFPKAAAYLIVTLDAAVYTSLIFVSGGLWSPFSFLYVFAIIGALPALKLRGAFFAAFISTLFYAFLGFLQYSGVPSPLETVISSVEGERLPEITLVEAIFKPFFTGLIFFFVAAVAGFLAERISTLHIEVENVRRKLRQARIDTKLILEQMPSGVAVIDLHGRILFFNASGKRLLGLHRVPKHLNELQGFCPGFHRVISRIMDELGEKGQGALEDTLTINGDDRAFNVRWAKLEEGETKGIVLAFEDITESKRLQEELKEKEKLAEIGYVAGLITHEVKTAATILKTAAELIASGRLNRGSKEAVKKILKDGSHKLSKTISNLMGFIRKESLDFQEIDLDKFLRDLISTYKILGLCDVPIDYKFQGPEKVVVDPLKFESIIRNILENALDAVKKVENPKIEIGTVPSGGEITGVTQNVTVESGFWGIYVKDNGIGINEDVRDKIMKPFFTTKSKGLGMGLTLSQKFIEAHGGKFIVDSKEGLGSIFIVLLPLNPLNQEGM
ncbi:MAG: hypothetical protein DRQ10_00780 [Candidatus Hydrothermota bacterium]|nr:MAG: hypothetical protein DRQ10_00780 [Candidatus Hydrothermae bacterium]